MGSVGGEEDAEMDNSNAHEEKIYVAVRARPLNEKEISKNDLSDWECIDNTTILFKNSLHERSLLPTAYTFDRVFGFDSPTKHVYDEAAKKIALSVLSGINSTIFAYGQTGSGKTFTMSGITECAIADIYDYIDKHCERKFVLKFSAMEIYNEAVRDLLTTDATPLRLLDDPERGTVVANLTEVTLKDSRQLKELLSVCEAQRQIGETSLNELSSRSHQILRLTVESESAHYLGAESASTLTASVNFVDLAGSERASQTLSSGTRLKEGSHINRSLLTLGTVIRKLSKGGKNGHIPFRDSKLTRILQNSLGGNARTAVICTISPAHSHVEQSRNTLHFANCAKQVSTSAQVNVVMSEKALVKQLQKELARLESELRNMKSLSQSGAPKSALKEKELLIQKMDQEIRELTNQRDMAQSRVVEMMQSGSQIGSWTDEYSSSEASEVMDPLRLEVISRSSSISRNSISRNSFSSTTSPRKRQPLAGSQASDPNLRTNKSCEAILASIMRGSSSGEESISSKKALVAVMKENSRRLSDARMHSSRPSLSQIDSPRFSDVMKQSNSVSLSRDNSKKINSAAKMLSSSDAFSRQSSQNSVVTEPKPVKQIGKKSEETAPPTKAKKKRRSNSSEETAASKAKKETEATRSATTNWTTEFQNRKREIVKLWDTCHIPLVHRSYFCLLFKGDPSDAVYMEVEQRRLSFLEKGGESSPKALQREREMLSRRMLKKLTTKEREALFEKWGIDVKSKQRRHQLCCKLWSDTENMEHVNESAEIVAKLAGLKEAGEAPKEIFGLSLATKQTNSRAFSWRNPIPSIIS